MKTPPPTTFGTGTYMPTLPVRRPGSDDFLRCPSLSLGQQRHQATHIQQLQATHPQDASIGRLVGVGVEPQRGKP